ncbi:MAG TPA: tyrosine-type recombinase/integrase [Acidimicrobiales bacterium]|nr:tyrosine-type recombinase/integrase [Acidimicrobiales bacterium]
MSEGDLVEWITAVPANNSVRGRLSTARTFIRWCLRTGLVVVDPTVELDGLTKQFPKTYGKVQAAHPARWLTYDEAYVRLLGACRDGTTVGLRDELAIRLGLLGIRSSEVARLRWGSVAAHGRLWWTGKGRRDRTVTAGPTLVALLEEWRTVYSLALGRRVADDDPLLRTEVLGAARQGGARRVRFGQPMSPRSFYNAVTTRAEAAGLGHVAPHDLRRTAAGLLHVARADDGGHLYDLLDIQQVLDHADPATTQRSYIDPLTRHDVKDRAAVTLD